MVINQYRKSFSYSFINTDQCPVLICCGWHFSILVWAFFMFYMYHIVFKYTFHATITED